MLEGVPEALRRDGFAVVPNAVAPADVPALIAALEAVQPGAAVRRRGSGVFAMRNLLELVPEVRRLATCDLLSLLEPVLGPGALPVRGLLFDKTPEANWNLAWHQDLTIAVRRRIDVPGFGAWSVKAGVPCVQPPASVLERMLALRLHLDDCGESSGSLRVLPGSHACGRLTAEAIRVWREQVPEVVCCVPRGGALLMWPLLLHASSPATAPGHRRVIHLEFAAEPLPGGLEWAEV